MDVQKLLEAHQKAVYGICFRVLRHPQDAEDACQDALVEAARHARNLRDPQAFGPWLRKVALTTALDLRRKRERRRLRDARFQPPEPSTASAEDLHQAISDLDDDTRWVVLEHYYEGRPLRTLASEAGVSEVTIWKRLEKGRERLRTRLAPAVYATLGAAVLLNVPEGLARKAWAAVEATATMKKIAIAALILIPPALIGGAALVSRPAAAPAPRESNFHYEAAKPTAVATPPAPKAAARDVQAAPVRKPWPLEFPPAHWPGGVKLAWEALMRKVTVDLQNVPLSELIAHVSREIQYPIAMAADLAPGEISFKVAEIVGDGALRLALQPRQMGYELREDGTILVVRRENLVSDRWGSGGIHQARYDLDLARRQLNEDYVAPSLRTAEEWLGKAVVMPAGVRDVGTALEALRDQTGAPVLVDAAARKDVEWGAPIPPVQAGSLESLLLFLLEPQGLVPAASPEGVVLLTTRNRAEEHRNSPEVLAARRMEAGLDAPLGWKATVGVPGLVERLERDFGCRVLASREAWEGAAELAPQDGETARSFLNRLGAWGVRWTVRNGTLFLIR
ncbi:MAG TPA: sigma-70 family RNA polymerase sigma factor [Planctomycetota bacterium]